MRFFLQLFSFFSTDFGKKVKEALQELIKIASDKLPNKPQFKEFGKKYGKEALFYGILVGDEELDKLIDASQWDEDRKEIFKSSISELVEMLSKKIDL